MLRFRRTRNLQLVHALITAPGAWDAATDDTAPAAADWRPHDDERVWYVLALDGDRAIALYTLIPTNAVCFEIHASRAFGRRSAEAAREVFGWAFLHTPARRIVASIPAHNRIAIRAAERAGMTRCGVNVRSFLKRGELVDQILLGISPE